MAERKMAYESWAIQSDDADVDRDVFDWWSNEDGWVEDINDATLFSAEEMAAVRLPIMGKWVIVNRCRHEKVNFYQKELYLYSVTSWNRFTHEIEINYHDPQLEQVEEFIVECRICGKRLDFEDVG